MSCAWGHSSCSLGSPSFGPLTRLARLSRLSSRRPLVPDGLSFLLLTIPTLEYLPMSEPFLSSDDYDEQAHQLYNEARYDEALTLLREGLSLYPHAVELHVGLAYAHLAREEFAWAARAFETAIALDPEIGRASC